MGLSRVGGAGLGWVGRAAQGCRLGRVAGLAGLGRPTGWAGLEAGHGVYVWVVRRVVSELN